MTKYIDKDRIYYVPRQDTGESYGFIDTASLNNTSKSIGEKKPLGTVIPQTLSAKDLFPTVAHKKKCLSIKTRKWLPF